MVHTPYYCRSDYGVFESHCLSSWSNSPINNIIKLFVIAARPTGAATAATWSRPRAACRASTTRRATSTSTTAAKWLSSDRRQTDKTLDLKIFPGVNNDVDIYGGATLEASPFHHEWASVGSE